MTVIVDCEGQRIQQTVEVEGVIYAAVLCGDLPVEGCVQSIHFAGEEIQEEDTFEDWGIEDRGVLMVRVCQTLDLSQHVHRDLLRFINSLDTERREHLLPLLQDYEKLHRANKVLKSAQRKQQTRRQTEGASMQQILDADLDRIQSGRS